MTLWHVLYTEPLNAARFAVSHLATRHHTPEDSFLDLTHGSPADMECVGQ